MTSFNKKEMGGGTWRGGAMGDDGARGGSAQSVMRHMKETERDRACEGDVWSVTGHVVGA